MSGQTSVPPITITPTGWIAPPQSALVAGATADFNAAFGGNLNPNAKTPQGQLVTSESAILGDSQGQQVTLFNGMDPAFSYGRQQDGIGRIYFMTRLPAQSTVLQVACSGLVNVPIPIGAVVSDPQNLYLCTGSGVIPISGSITLSFAAVNPGPLAVPASVQIAQSILGWSSATLVSGVVGNAVETRAAFEARRGASVAANGAGFPPTIRGAILAVPDVISTFVYSNNTASPATINGVTVAANALYVCVAGGAAQAIGQAIWSKLNPGCATQGGTAVTVYDSNSGYSPPYPSYTINYDVATNDAICMNVVIKSSSLVPSNAAVLIQAAIVTAFLGEMVNGPIRPGIGSEIFALNYAAAAASAFAGCQVVSITIGQALNSPAAAFTGSIAGVTLTVSGVTGTIAIGQFVYAVGGPDTVASGTIITAGAGSSWTVAVNQTVSSVTMNAVAAASADLTVQSDQMPTLAGADINVTTGS